MTNEQVNELENTLRKAEGDLEKAGQLLCNERDEGRKMWDKVNELVSGVQDLIHNAYKLRPISVDY